MTDTAVAHPNAAAGHDDPMSHVPPPSFWPAVTTLPLFTLPFGVLAVLGALPGWGPLASKSFGVALCIASAAVLLFGLMGWAHQIIHEKPISHDAKAQQKDLQLFILLFLVGEFMAFSAIFGYYFYRQVHDAGFGPLHASNFHFGGPLVAYATFMLLTSSITCEFAHHAIEHGKHGLARFLLLATIGLGIAFLACTGYEWGELIWRGFYPMAIENDSASAFASIFYTSTGFHALHVAIGLAMLMMVLLRHELGHFRGRRTFAVTAASWYWHFVDIVWVVLFITVYVVA